MAGRGRGPKKGALIAVIGDEDTCTGFLLGGVGDINDQREANFLVVSKETNIQEIEDKFKSLVKRQDIAILVINQHIAEDIRPALEAHDQPVPTIVVIPSKEHAYDPTKDPEMERARRMFAGDDFR